jgi:hypothetical protein
MAGLQRWRLPLEVDRLPVSWRIFLLSQRLGHLRKKIIAFVWTCFFKSLRILELNVFGGARVPCRPAFFLATLFPLILEDTDYVLVSACPFYELLGIHFNAFSLLTFRPDPHLALLKLDVNHIRMTTHRAVFDVFLARSG